MVFLEADDMPLAFDMTPSRQGEVHSNPWFSSINALAAAMFDRPYDLAVNAYASRVFVENGKVSGVEVFSADKKAHTIRAKNVVLSASTLETPRILLNSGIQGRYWALFNRACVHHWLSEQSARREFSDKLGNLSILKFETK